MEGLARGERGMCDHDLGLGCIKGRAVPVCLGEHTVVEQRTPGGPLSRRPGATWAAGARPATR